MIRPASLARRMRGELVGSSVIPVASPAAERSSPAVTARRRSGAPDSVSRTAKETGSGGPNSRSAPSVTAAGTSRTGVTSRTRVIVSGEATRFAS